MRRLSYAASKARYAEMLDTVAREHEEVVVVRPSGPAVVVVALEDYLALKEAVGQVRSSVIRRRVGLISRR